MNMAHHMRKDQKQDQNKKTYRYCNADNDVMSMEKLPFKFVPPNVLKLEVVILRSRIVKAGYTKPLLEH